MRLEESMPVTKPLGDAINRGLKNWYIQQI